MPVANGVRFSVKQVALLAAFMALWIGGCELLGSNSLDEKNETVELPDSLAQRYTIDAAVLSVRFLRRTKHEQLDEVKIPDEVMQPVYNALVKVYEAADLAARDSVVKIYNIHAQRSPEVLELLISVDTSYRWVRAWKEGKRLTGNEKVDSLLTAFDLHLKEFNSRAVFAVLKAETPLNLLALGQRFEAVEGVVNASSNDRFGGSHDIGLQVGNRYRELRYSVGYGDCPAGCISRHYWTFRVYNEGRVEYLGSSGDPAPEPR